jgi:hypothetical protein
MFIRIIITTTDTATTIGIPAIIFGSMTLFIGEGLHTGTEQRAGVSIRHCHPCQEEALIAVIRAEILNGKALVLFQGPANRGKI